MKNLVTKKYQFGAGFGEILNEELAIQQMRARNFLRNELVALDRKTREQYYAIVGANNPAQDSIAKAFDTIAELRDELLMLRVPPARKALLRLEAVAIRTEQNAAKDLSGIEKKKALSELKKKSAALAKKVEAAQEQSAVEVKEQKDALKLQIDTLKKTITDLKPVAKAKQQENKDNNSEALAKLNTERKAKVNALRTRAVAGYTEVRTKENGETFSIVVPPLYNLNADEIIAQHDTERSRAMKDKTELRFHRFIGEGRSSVRVHSYRDKSDGKEELFDKLQAAIDELKENRRQTVSKEKKQKLSLQIETAEADRDSRIPNYVGQTEEETFAGDSTLFRIDAVNLQRDVQNPTVWNKGTVRGDRRRAMRTVAHIRIQSEEKGKPVFLSIPIVMHRPFPVGARILSAAVNREKIGLKFRWNVEFTVLFNEVALPPASGIVTLDLGWAKDSLPGADGRIRVAGVRERTPDGQETFTEFCLPASFTEYAKKLEDIHSIRDKHTNEAFEKIAAFRAVYDIKDAALRTLLDRAKASLAARKGGEPPVGHLRSAVWMLRNNEVEAQLELKDILEAWYERWNHLNEWLSNGRDNQLAAKKDYYRRFAYALAQRNDTLLLDADNFAKMAREKTAEHDEKPAKNEVRFLAAPAMLRSALEACFTEEKGKQVLWSSLASSKTCSKCWKRNEDLGASRTFTCPACGFTADREENATANVMGEYLRKPGSFSADKKVAERLAAAKEEELSQAVAA